MSRRITSHTLTGQGICKRKVDPGHKSYSLEGTSKPRPPYQTDDLRTPALELSTDDYYIKGAYDRRRCLVLYGVGGGSQSRSSFIFFYLVVIIEWYSLFVYKVRLSCTRH